MGRPLSGKLILSTAFLFALTAIPAFANHGGGGGGGSHGGGGFHGGGGSHANGGSGGRSYSAPAAGYGASRSYSPAMRSGQGYTARPGYGYSRPSGNMAAGNQRYGNSASARPGVADGQWHSFGSPAENRGASGAPSQSANTNGGWHVMSGNRGTATAGTVRSFSGQGGEVWENAPASRNVVSRSQSLSSIHNSFSGAMASNSALRGGSGFAASSRFNAGSPLLTHNGFLGGAGTAVPQLRGGFGFNGFGGGFGGAFGRPFGGFGRGCWNCGFGLGFGWGGWGWGGWPWLGFGWDPFWADPWWGGPAPPYGYYAYPGSGYYGPDDNYNPPPQEDNGPESYNEGPVNGNWVTPNGPSPVQVPNAAAFSVPILIYMKNGSVLTVRDYWMVDDDLHYLTMSGAEKTSDLEAVDLPRTNTENAKSGVKFIFKSEPSVVAPAPDGSGAPPAAQPNAQPGAPRQQINAGPQSESHT
jgi:hypothetical protein